MGLYEDNYQFYINSGMSPEAAANEARRNADAGRNVAQLSGQSGYTLGSGDAQVAVPGFIDYNAQEILDQALSDAREQGEFNKDIFLSSFNNLANKLAQDTINTELEGLETFVPRASSLIREQDQDRNQEVLTQSDIFDSRNLRAAQGATAANTALRRDIFSSFAPGVRDSLLSSLDRLEGDTNRIRQRESRSILTDSLRDVGARSARLQGADVGAAGGFGISSGTTRSFIDRFDLDRRIQLEEDELNRQRQGDTSILNSESAVQSAAAASANLFNNVIAPGIQDFSPIQAQPTVTDIGSQIRPTPSVDAGTLRRQFTGELTDLQSLSPGAVFGASQELQDRELTFQQDVFNTQAEAKNNLFGLQQELRREQLAQQNFEAGLDLRKKAEKTQAISQGISTFVTSALDIASNFLTGDGGGTASTGVTGQIGSLLKGVSQLAGLNVDSLPSVFTEGTSDLPSGIKFLTGNGGAEVTSSLAGTMAVVGGALATGLGVKETLDGLTDGSITQDDIYRGLTTISTPSAAMMQGVNDFLGKPISENDFNNVMMMANPVTAPLALLNMAGVDIDFSTGKSEDQQFRDALRYAGQENGFVSDDYKVTLANGSTFDIGKDGSSTLENVGTNTNGREDRFYYEVDFSNPIAPEVVGYSNPLSLVLYGNKEGQKFVGHLTNAITSGNTTDLSVARANAKTIALQAGQSYESGIARLDALAAKGGILNEELSAYKNGWYNMWFGGN